MSLSKPVSNEFEPLYAWAYKHAPGRYAWDKDEYLVFGLKYHGPSCSLIRFTDFKPFFWANAEGLSDYDVSLLAEQLASRVRLRLFSKRKGGLLKVPWEDYKCEKDDENCEWRRFRASLAAEEAEYYEGDYGIANKALVEVKVKMREVAEGYDPTSPTDATRRKFRFMRIRCYNEAVLREAVYALKRPFKLYNPRNSGGGLKAEIRTQVFEDNVKAIKRFQYRTHLRPSSWFLLKSGGYEEVEAGKLSRCKKEYKASYRSIVAHKDLDPAAHLYPWGIPNADEMPILRTMVMDTEHEGKTGFPLFKNIEDHLISVGHVYVDKRPTDQTATVNKEIFVYANPNSERFASALTKRKRSGLVRSLKMKKKVLEIIARNAQEDGAHPQVKSIIQDLDREYRELRGEPSGFDAASVSDCLHDREIEAAMKVEDTFDELIEELGREEDETYPFDDLDPMDGNLLGDFDEGEAELVGTATKGAKRAKVLRGTSKHLVGLINDVKVYMYDSVLKTYQGWMKRVSELDPDIILTYNGDKFDWAKFYTELTIHAAEAPAKIEGLRMSRLKDEVCVVENARFSSRAKGENHYMRTKMTGRFVYDLLDFAKSTYKRKNYSLNAMLSFMNLPPKDEVSIKGINDSIKTGGDLLAKVLEYCCVDCERTFQLSEKCNFTIQSLKVSHVAYTDMSDIAKGGNSCKNMNLLSYECRCKKLVINHVPSKKPPGQFRWEEKIDNNDAKSKWFKCNIMIERKPATKEEFLRWFPKNSVTWVTGAWRKKDGVYATLIKTKSEEHKAEIEKRLIERGLFLIYSGATVIDPFKGLHDCCCPTLDFNSLYPSIIMAYNLCYQTIVKNLEYLTWACMKDTFVVHRVTKDRVHYFVKKDLYCGIVPTILQRLTTLRKKVQAMMEYEADSAKKLALNVLQLVLKIMSNALYGFMGFALGPWPLMPAAETVTYRGRTGLELTGEYVESQDLIQIITPANWNNFLKSHHKRHDWPITWYPHDEPGRAVEVRGDGRMFFRPVVRPNKFDCPTTKVCPCPLELNCACVRKKHCVEATGGALKTLERMRKAISEMDDDVFEIDPATNRFYEDRIQRAREASSDFRFVWDTYGPLCTADELPKYMRRIPELVARHPDDDKYKALIIYGDTDSVMPKCPVTTDRHGRRIAVMLGELLADMVTSIMVPGLRLAFEKVYQPILLSKKKRYAGYKWMSPDDLDPKIEVKGFQNQRRDFIPTYSSYLDACIGAILKDRNYDNALLKEAELKENIINDKINIKDFEQSKSFKGFYAQETVIQAVAAKQKIEAGFGETLAGDRIYFFIGDTGNPKHKTYQKVIESTCAMQYYQNGSVPPGFKSIVDHVYYLEHFLRNPYVALMTPYCGSTKAAHARFDAFLREIETRKIKNNRTLNDIFAKDERSLEERETKEDQEEIDRKRRERLERLKQTSELLQKNRGRRGGNKGRAKAMPSEADVPNIAPVRKIAKRVRRIQATSGPMDDFVTTQTNSDSKQ